MFDARSHMSDIIQAMLPAGWLQKYSNTIRHRIHSKTELSYAQLHESKSGSKNHILIKKKSV